MMLTGIVNEIVLWCHKIEINILTSAVDKIKSDEKIHLSEAFWLVVAEIRTLQYEYIKYEIYNNQNTPDNFIGTHGLFQTMSQHLFYFILYFFIFF